MLASFRILMHLETCIQIEIQQPRGLYLIRTFDIICMLLHQGEATDSSGDELEMPVLQPQLPFPGPRSKASPVPPISRAKPSPVPVTSTNSSSWSPASKTTPLSSNTNKGWKFKCWNSIFQGRFHISYISFPAYFLLDLYFYQSLLTL